MTKRQEEQAAGLEVVANAFAAKVAEDINRYWWQREPQTERRKGTDRRQVAGEQMRNLALGKDERP